MAVDHEFKARREEDDRIRDLLFRAAEIVETTAIPSEFASAAFTAAVDLLAHPPITIRQVMGDDSNHDSHRPFDPAANARLAASIGQGDDPFPMSGRRP